MEAQSMEAQGIVLTVDECARILKISRPQAYLGVHKGCIPSIRVGRRILIPVASLNKLLATAGSKE